MAKADLRREVSASLDSLVLAIHAAGVDEGEWPSVLECLRSDLSARVVTLGRHEFNTGSDAALFESPIGAGFTSAMAGFSARNPWFLSTEDYAPGRVMTGDELISHADLQRTDFYRDFLKPHGLLHRLCAVVARRENGAFFLSAYRGEDQDPFGSREKAELEFLMGHISLSMNSHWRWQEASDLSQALLGLTDHDSNPVILVTALGEPVYRNPAADELLASHIGLRLDGTRVVAASPADQRMLRETIAQAAQAEPAAALSPRVVTIACTPPMPPVVAVVRSAGQVFAREAGVRRGLVMISIRGGHAAHDPAACAFARQYELTAAQAKVSALVFGGQPLSTIAVSLKVSENTVRSHLKQIFQKTSTHGQMDLVHLHARTCASLR
jgi:DNA-binding CsgD family transcriptional regulator